VLQIFSNRLTISSFRSVYSDVLKAEQVTTAAAFDKVQERTTYQLTNTLPAGSKAELKIAFGGELTGSMMGYYKASWQHEGKTKYYALTQFEVRGQNTRFFC
jgi:aminopeptidase 2